MFIILDSTDQKLLVEAYDAVNELDDKPVMSLKDVEDSPYIPGGSYHVVDLESYWSTPSSSQRDKAKRRWLHMVNASLGVRIFSDTEWKNDPLYAGKLPRTPEEFEKKMIASARFADQRSTYFRGFNVNYIGRTNLSPRNVIVLDNKKGNPLHSPLIDESLIPLYANMESDWWGSCGIVSSGNVDRLGAFFDEFIDEVVPLGYTAGSHAKLKSFGVDFAKIPAPVDDPKWGTQVREIANRLSYDLSL